MKDETGSVNKKGPVGKPAEFGKVKELTTGQNAFKFGKLLGSAKTAKKPSSRGRGRD